MDLEKLIRALTNSSSAAYYVLGGVDDSREDVKALLLRVTDELEIARELLEKSRG